MDFMKIAILEILRNMQNHKQNHRFFAAREISENQIWRKCGNHGHHFFCNSA